MTNEIITLILLVLCIAAFFKLLSMVGSGHEFEIKVFVYIVAILILKFSVDLLSIDSDEIIGAGFFTAAFTFCLGLLFGHGGRQREEDSDEKWLIKYREEREAEEEQDIREDIAAGGMAKWVGYKFGSSKYMGTKLEFPYFASDFLRHLKRIMPKSEGWEITSFDFDNSNFEVRGFLKKGDKFAYFKAPDVRRYQDAWNERILIRTAKGDKDYAGGPIRLTTLEDFVKNVEDLMS